MSRQVNLGQIIPNIQVGETITGNAGTQANVENTGTNLNPILNFTIPKGTTGSAGKDAKINGVNTLSIEAGTNITLDQQGNTLTINSTGGGGTSDYSDLTNKPSINNVTLSGNKSLSDLGIQPSGSYATTTDLATKQDITDNNLTTTNKTVTSAINEVNSIAKGANQAIGYSDYQTMITAINSLSGDEYNVGQNVYIVTVNVPDLWVSSVESTSSTYTYVDDATVVNDLETNGYIQVGYYKLSMLETQKVDLTNYVTNTDYAGSNKAGVIKTTTYYGTGITSAGALLSATKTYQQYQDTTTTPNMFISKGTLENVIEGKGLVSNTDYAGTATAGVIRTNPDYGTSKTSIGALISTTKTYQQYKDTTTQNMFISKGTLENVIEGKGLVSNTDYAGSNKAGVIKCFNSDGLNINSGTLITATKTYAQYNSAGNWMFVGKGTLENVITGKELDLKQLSTFDSTKTQVLKNINGTLTWVNE